MGVRCRFECRQGGSGLVAGVLVNLKPGGTMMEALKWQVRGMRRGDPIMASIQPVPVAVEMRLLFLFVRCMALLLLAAMQLHAAPLQPAFWACNPRPDLDFNVTFGTRIPNCCSHAELMTLQAEPEHKTWQQYLEQNPLPRELRFRPAAHLVAGNETYLRQLDLAYRLIRAIPDADPRSQFQQMNLHCIYGVQGVVPQAGALDLDYTVHSNWLFFPFHRWFTFFYERILAKLVGDETFALPFWNWDNQTSDLEQEPPHAIPGFMKDPDRYPGLYNKYRDPRHAPDAPRTMVNCIKESVFEGYSAYSAEEMVAQRAMNNAHLHEVIVKRTANGEREPFLSFPARKGAMVPDFSEFQGTFESQPHIAVHFWVGDRAYSYADMGVTYHAVRDPLFFLHHANVDRLWNVWLGLEGRSNYDDPDFLDAAFYFYDENAEVVKVTVADCLHSDLLGYSYQQVDNPWLTYDASQHQQTFPQHAEA